MEHHSVRKYSRLKQIIARYEAMSQRGAVNFIEEAVYLDMLDFCEVEGKRALALRIVTDAIAQHPFSAELYLRKAQFLLNDNKIEESLVTIEQAQIFAPQHVLIGLLHAELLSIKGEHLAALDILTDLKENASRDESAEIHLTEAHIYEDLRQYRQMFDALRRSLVANPANTEGYEKMIWATEYSGQYRESVAFHNYLIDKDAYNWRAWLNLGFAQEALLQIDEAIEAFEFAFAIEESCHAAYMEAGELLIQKGDFARAQCVLENCIFNTQEDYNLLRQLGLCAQKQGNWDTAKQYYHRALEMHPRDAEALYHLGECAAFEKKYKKAIELYSRAIGVDNRQEAYHAALAEAYWRTEQFGRALSSYRKAALMAPDDVDYWLRYAGFLFKVGQEKKALQVLKDAENYACSAEIEYCQIACLLSLGRRGEALYRLSEALAQDFDKHTALLHWQPDFAQSSDFKNLINEYRPE
jgi:tetratricopeptide (TPR) repeat protein